MARRKTKSKSKKEPSPKSLSLKQLEPKEWIGLDAIAPYADMIRVNTSERGFMLTFGQAHPDVEEIRVVGRVVLPPKSAGELLAVLVQQVQFYQQHFETIIPQGVDVEIQNAEE